MSRGGIHLFLLDFMFHFCWLQRLFNAFMLDACQRDYDACTVMVRWHSLWSLDLVFDIFGFWSGWLSVTAFNMTAN